MKAALKFKGAMCILFVAILWLFAPIAQAEAAGFGGHRGSEPEFSAPPLISLTGILYPPEQKVAGMYRFTVFAKDKEWTFVVEKARNISGLEPAQKILRDLFPSTLYLWGSNKLITPLEKPEVVGKLITIEGYVHVANNIIEVRAVRGLS